MLDRNARGDCVSVQKEIAVLIVQIQVNVLEWIAWRFTAFNLGVRTLHV